MKFGLCMIVKDESHIIKEVLESTVALIDTYVIVDTGSSDNTIQIIKDFYTEKGIEGEVFEREWKGFGASRSEALKLCDGRMDYILMIDADDLMSFPPGAKKIFHDVFEKFTPNALHIEIRRGIMQYARTQIFKAGDGWRYVGVLHEYPTNDKKDNKIGKLPSEIHMIGRTLGNRSKGLSEKEKYSRDAETLLAEVEKEPDNDRYVFYLAQSYRDAGNKEEAIKWYKKRFEMGRWKEEMYVSAYNVCRLTGEKEWAMKATETCPHRAEALVAYVTACRVKGEWSQEVLSLALLASSIEKPAMECLFIETDVYAWRVWDELAIAAAFTGRKDLCKKACVKLLHDNTFPNEHRARIENNLKAVL